MDMAVYEHGVRRADELELEDAYEACRIDGSFAWIGLYKPTPEELEAVRREFNLHEVAIEDAQVGHQRPKVEVYGESLFVVLKPASYDEEAEL